MFASRFSLGKRTIAAALFGEEDRAYFWEAYFWPKWFPLLLGLGLGMILALLIAKESWYFLIPVAVAAPVIAFFIHYPFAAVLVWMLLLPYFLNEPTTAGRAIFWILHRAMVPSALGIVILSDWLGIRKQEPVKLGRAELAMLLFLGLTLANIVLLNGNPKQSVFNLYDWLFVPFCMYWLVRLTAPGEQALKRFLGVAFITLVAECVIGLLGWFAPEVLPPQWINQVTQGARTVGSLRNVAVYTSTLLFLALLLLQHAMTCRSKHTRRLLLVFFCLAIFCVFFSFSRGSWLGGSTILLSLILLYPKTMLRLTIILVVAVYLLSNSVLAREVAWGYERLSGKAAQRSANNRVIANHAAFSMIKARPFFGWGFNNYDLYYPQFTTRVGDVPTTLGYGVTAHNTYLALAAELGLIGLFLYMFPAAWWLILSLKVWRRLPPRGFSSWRLLAMLWLLMLHMFIVCNFMNMYRPHLFGTTVWWMALGLIANIVYPYLKREDIATSYAPQSTSPPGYD